MALTECIQKNFLQKYSPRYPYPPYTGGTIQRGRGTTLPRWLARDKKIKKVGEKMERKRAPTAGKIKESLIKQLEVKNANVPHFYDLILDYLELYNIKKALQKDIKKRGVSYETLSANGFEITKQNQSVKDLVAVEKQMMSMLKEMGLTTDAPTGSEDVDEDL